MCDSDAFLPFPYGVETCLAAGVTAVVESGGSHRETMTSPTPRAMVLTGRGHFRH